MSSDRITCEVAILMATYNGEDYIREQLQSLVDQSFQNFVCYIHDDNSIDGTISIIRQFEKKWPQKFILLNYKGENGAVGNFMSLIQYAKLHTKEPYIMFCDQDDVWHSNKISLQLEEIKKKDNGESPVLVYCAQELVDKNLRMITNSALKYSGRDHINDDFIHLVFENSAAGCVMCINRKLLCMSCQYHHINNIVMHDWWAMLIAACWGNIFYLDIPLMKYRQHANNTLGAESNDILYKIKKYLKNPLNSFIKKYKHVKKCERQVIELLNISDESPIVNNEVKRFAEICKKNKLKRMCYFFKNKYIEKKGLFTLFFT